MTNRELVLLGVLCKKLLAQRYVGREDGEVFQQVVPILVRAGVLVGPHGEDGVYTLPPVGEGIVRVILEVLGVFEGSKLDEATPRKSPGTDGTVCYMREGDLWTACERTLATAGFASSIPDMVTCPDCLDALHYLDCMPPNKK